MTTTLAQDTFGGWLVDPQGDVSTLGVVSLFVLTEISPFMLTLDSGFLELLDQDDEGAASQQPARLSYS